MTKISCSFHGSIRAPLQICPSCVGKLQRMETSPSLMSWDQAMVYFFLEAGEESGKGCLLIDAFDENTGRGNATKEGKHLESTFKYIKHVLIPQCRYREKPTTTPIVALECGKTLVAPWECGGSVKSNKDDDEDDSVSATSRTSGTMSDENSSSSSSSSAPSDESTASVGTTGTKTIAASVTTWSQMETQDSVRRMMQKQTSVRGNARFH